IATSSVASPIRPTGIKMTERKTPPGEPHDKIPREPSKNELAKAFDTSSKETHPDDGLLEKIRWAKESIKQNPKTAAALGLTAGGLTVVAAPGLLTGPVLSMIGFGSSGIVGGSFAAGIQGMMGNVVAGSWFAAATSAAMGGCGVPVVAAIGQGVGATAAFVGGAYAAKDHIARGGVLENDLPDGLLTVPSLQHLVVFLAW
ncbi:hypothetical protein QBC32DRAFT_204534, partial [Pseudoneurospora amorphoporcata]